MIWNLKRRKDQPHGQQRQQPGQPQVRLFIRVFVFDVCHEEPTAQALAVDLFAVRSKRTPSLRPIAPFLCWFVTRRWIRPWHRPDGICGWLQPRTGPTLSRSCAAHPQANAYFRQGTGRCCCGCYGYVSFISLTSASEMLQISYPANPLCRKRENWSLVSRHTKSHWKGRNPPWTNRVCLSCQRRD